MSLLVINPNSTEAITDGLRASLLSIQPANVQLAFFTAPPPAPTGISNFVTAIQTAYICFGALLKDGALDKHDGFLVCCCQSHLALPVSAPMPAPAWELTPDRRPRSL